MAMVNTVAIAASDVSTVTRKRVSCILSNKNSNMAHPL